MTYGARVAVFRWLLVVAWLSVIFYLSSKPISDYPEVVPDYVAHFFEYSVLAFLFWYALSYNRTLSIRLYFLTLVFTVFYGLTDEIHQLFVPTRTFSLFDLSVDGLAAGFTTVVVYLFWRRPLNSKT